MRTCKREKLYTIEEVRKVLHYEVRRYNEQQVHSATREIPAIRFERAIKDSKSLFCPFKVPYPYESSKDIFSIREQRTTNAYRKISLNGIELRVPGVLTRMKRLN